MGAAVGAPFVGYLADRLGQKHVLLVAAVVNALLVGAVVLLAYALLPSDGHGWPTAPRSWSCSLHYWPEAPHHRLARSPASGGWR
ncbi:hypothetical protein NHF46_14855 [Arthrobacter alpinus]|nr:hypothetical protein [Arthrobacter alpinus]